MKNFMNISLAALAISVSGCSSTPAEAVAFQGRVIEFKSGTDGFDTRTFFYEGRNEVIAFDAQFTPALAQQSIDHLRKFTAKPITWLVITHPNPDKFNGASVFKAQKTKILSSKATAAAIPGVHAYKEYFFVEMSKMFKKGTYPQPVPVDHTFETETDLVLSGGERIKLRELSNPGVSGNQTVVFIPAIKSLMVGDLVHHKAHAWLEGGIVNGKPTPTIDGWISDLQELAKLFPRNTIVYGGRGLSANLETVVPEQIRYLQLAREMIRRGLRAMGSKANDFNGPKAPALYKSLADHFQSTFSGYDLSYMIEYGAYGLVQQELKRLK